MKRFLFFLLIFLFVTWTNICSVWAESDNKVVVYFYSPTCASCDSVSDFLEDLSETHKNFEIKRYDISNLKNKSLMDKYSEAYGVSAEDEGIVPIVFIGDMYFSDVELLRNNFEKEIIKPGVKTLEIDSSDENHEKDIIRFEGFKTASVFLAGLVNGINPCSMSMLLFFLSLLTVKKARILKIALSFISGKFLAFFLLGTILFKFLSLFNFSLLSILTKILLAVVLLFLIVMSIQDYFAAKAERYDKIFLQLPVRLRKFNHNIIKKATDFSNVKLTLVISFFLGIILSFGEFLCTGQIYLATIITIFQTNSVLSARALLYLIIYNLGVILPLMALSLIIYKGKEMFEVSEAIRERLHIIKLINAIIFLVFGIIIFLFF
ncbi:glutaredoxin family protein [Ruminiclostridium herbifermentans]|uniref:Glutaredoxin family protein n=1 Tax=Ruminiclostridium herbifermentans TaxID=2488810 RepID=A0A4U7JIA3_9FIRM|nr:cytochrome c biogenesis protein CcdA [Ruminiclostridium herbifermentans]QNU66649.1 glutaredoxin family protein [Ruminiclostridium herbifermentans]